MKRFSMLVLATVLCLLTTTAMAQNLTSWTMTSDPGSIIGPEMSYSYTATSGTWDISSYGNGVQVLFHTPTYDHSWAMLIAPPTSGVLLPGSYINVPRSRDAVNYGFSVFGDGRGCNSSVSNVTLKYLERDVNGEPTAIWLSFDQRCSNEQSWVHGAIMVNVPLATPTRPTTWGSLKSTYR